MHDSWKSRNTEVISGCKNTVAGKKLMFIQCANLSPANQSHIHCQSTETSRISNSHARRPLYTQFTAPAAWDSATTVLLGPKYSYNNGIMIFPVYMTCDGRICDNWSADNKFGTLNEHRPLIYKCLTGPFIWAAWVLSSSSLYCPSLPALLRLPAFQQNFRRGELMAGVELQNHPWILIIVRFI